MNLRNRHTENIIYACIWLLVAVLYLCDEMRTNASHSLPLLNVRMFVRMSRNLSPYFLVFLINNFILFPRLFLNNKITKYFLSVSVLIILLWIWQFVVFTQHPFFGHMESSPFPGVKDAYPMEGEGLFGRTMPMPPKRLIPLPLFMDFTYGLVVLGVNLAISLMFQRFEYRLENTNLQKLNAETELAYLKNQINPHFYMNMLNNIHGMIEINPERAQTMVIDMSQLMRYMLYDSSLSRVTLWHEILFMQNYLRLMRMRYPENRVDISFKYPDERECGGMLIPPLLFLVFMENAFKHGISYKHKSFVSVSLEIIEGNVLFKCLNSKGECRKDTRELDDGRSGIGMRNIKQRLNLIYGSNAALTINETENTYIVTLSVPSYEA